MKNALKILGCKAKDVVTGASGVVTSVSFDLYGCIMVWLTPSEQAKQKEKAEGSWYDFKRIEVSGKPVMKQPDFVLGTEPGPEAKGPPPQ